MNSRASCDRPQLLAGMSGISKSFGKTAVLKNARLEMLAGEVHVLAGENGAGKSTLIKILAGVHTEFDGRIEIGGCEVRPKSPLEANALGIAVIHQELSLIGAMSVADNIFLGWLPTRVGFVQDAVKRARAAKLLLSLGLDLDVDQPVEQFPIAIQQLIEIGKALGQNAKVIVMDEPTSALNAPEVERLFTLIKSLKQQGCSIVYISHKMEEIERIADRITVLRDGEWIGTAMATELPMPKLIKWMVGREMNGRFSRPANGIGEERLRLESFSVFPKGLANKPTVEKISLSVRAGEVLGLGGLQGSGASELFLGLFGGYGRATRGNVFLDGKPVRHITPRQSIESGVALLTNDRKASGLVLSMSIIANATLAGLTKLSPAGWLRPDRELAASKDVLKSMRLQAVSLDMEAGELSGGNQQKVVIAKWLQTRPRLLLLDEPTRGIDIAAKQTIYEIINEWTAQGVAVLLITSEMPELLALSDRIAVMHRGSLTAEFSRAQATPEAVLTAAMGSNSSLQPKPIFQVNDRILQNKSLAPAVR